MLKKLLSVAMVALLCQVAGLRVASAATHAEKDAAKIERVKAGIAKLGTGRETSVAVKLRDKTKLKGFISEAGADGFVVNNPKTGETRTVSYGDVAQVKGRNNVTGSEIAITIAVVSAIILIGIIVALSAS